MNDFGAIGSTGRALLGLLGLIPGVGPVTAAYQQSLLQGMQQQELNALFGAGMMNAYRPQPIPTDPFEREYLWIVDGTGRTWGEFVDAGYR